MFALKAYRFLLIVGSIVFVSVAIAQDKKAACVDQNESECSGKLRVAAASDSVAGQKSQIEESSKKKGKDKSSEEDECD